MKALIKGGLFLALGWLTGNAVGQEMQWKAATSRSGGASAAATPIVDTGVRGVSLSMPVPLDAPATAGDPSTSGVRSFVPIAATVRAQAAEDNKFTVQPLPMPMPMPAPRPLPNDTGTGSFVPPPPATLSASPVWDSVGGTCGTCGTDCCTDACGTSWLGRHFFQGTDDGCCPYRGRFWVGAEMLLWFQRADHVPPLVTSSPAGVPLLANGQAVAGALGQSSTTVLYDSLPDRLRAGGRIDMGMWFARCPNLGMEVNFLTLGQQTDNSVFNSNGNPQLFRPFFNTDPANGLTPQQFTELVAVPNLVSGSVAVAHYSQLWGAEGLFRYKWCCGANYWVDLLFGYRHLNLSEGIDITENLTVVPARGGANILVQDSFHTRSQFNGFETGISSQWYFLPRWSLYSTFKLAMGSTHEVLDINGSTTVNGVTSPGGLLALQGTNMGHFTQDKFAILPEFGLKIGWDITPRLQLFAGYEFLYLSNAIRPGEQINTNVNPNFQPGNAMTGPRQPTVLFNTTGYWAQGVNLGLLYRF